MSEKTELKSTYNKFYAVGKVRVNKKNGFVIDATSKNNEDYVYSSASLHLDCGKERLSFAQLIGGYNVSDPLPIKVSGKDNDGKEDYKKRFEVDWEDREDKEILKDVGDSNFITVGLETYTDEKTNKEKVLYKKFLSAYDAIPYIEEHLKEDTVVRVNGDVKFGIYNDKTSVNKNITYIALSNAEEEKFYATFRIKLLIDNESLGEEDEEGLVPLSGYVIDWHKAAKGNIAIPYTIFVDPSKYKNWENIKKKLQPKDSNDIWLWGINGIYAIQSETVEVTVDDLPDDLKEMIEDGMISEEEAIVRAVGGNKSKEIALFDTFQTRKDENNQDVYDRETELYTAEDLVFASHFDKKGSKSKGGSTKSKGKSASKDPFTKTDLSKVAGIDEDLEDFLNDL